jgi:hypothetical protein
MTNVPNRLTIVDRAGPGGNPVNPPTYVSARVLAANTAESITVPAGVSPTGAALGIASYVRIAVTADTYYSFSGAATVPVDTDDGTACELLKAQSEPEWRLVPPGATALSVISAAIGTVTASFYLV